jgi:hypothetical protein
MGFQSGPVSDTFAPAIAGDFADHNPRAMVNAGPGGIVAGPSGLYVGRFCWLSQSYLDPDNAPQIANNSGVGAPAGFVGNTFQGLNTTYLSDNGLLVRAGMNPGAIYNAGGFWILNSGTTAALLGQTCYAALTTGLGSFGAAGSAPAVTAATSSIAAATFSGFTGSLTGNLLTITVVGTGSIYPGATLTAGGAASGTMILSQISGTVGGVGGYSVSIPEQAVALNASWGGSYGILTLGATPSGTFGLGAALSGSSVVAGTYVGAYISGNGAASGNTLAVSNNTVVSSTTITATSAVATNWVAASQGAAGEIIKITTWTQN